jgi:hypothetical protein
VTHINRKPIETLLHQDHYTPRELANLLEMSQDVIHHEVWNGHLKARQVGHQIIDIRREDALDWLRERHEHLVTDD